jgi:hypothetical protein
MATPRAEPRLPIIIFGNGLQAQLLKINPAVPNKDGVRMVKIKLRPTENLFYFSNLRREDLNHVDMSIVREYQESMIKIANNDPRCGAIHILCTFEGTPSPLSELHHEYTSKINGLHKENKDLKAEVAYVRQENRKITAQLPKYIKDQTDIFEQVMSLRKREPQDMGMMSQEQGDMNYDG